MAKKLELSDPQVAALMRQQRKLIPWCSASYNDEITLMSLRDTHPKADWSTIRDLFNKAVPSKRKRSVDSIKNKWRILKAKCRESLQLDIVDPLEGDVSNHIPSSSAN